MDLSKLNEQQFNAVTDSYDSNVALIASAGSGKTTVLTKRIQFLIEEMGVEPKNIMAITFTNKAANEMKERVERETDVEGMWIGTFHSICVNILRMFPELLPVNKKFTILDGKDSIAMLKNVLSDTKVEVENKNAYSNFMSKISEYKNNYISPKRAIEEALNNGDKQSALIYKEYYERCKKSHCLDFDDLIIYAINLFKHKKVRDWFKKNIKYLLIDEFQDSNYTQILLAKCLSQGNNVFVVGDIKQSIYGFRNAKPEYFENFTDVFENSKIMYLQRNYRSTQTIVNAGNDIIKNNKSKLDSTSFTTNKEGDKIIIKECDDPEDEAYFVANTIKCCCDSYNDIAILYSKHSQGIAIENELIRCEIPYEIVKGTSYFEKKEIKDIMAILKLKSNPYNEEAFTRTCTQIEGMGKVTVKNIIKFKEKNNIDFFTACKLALDPNKKTGKKILSKIIPIIELNTTNIPDLILELYSILDIREKYKVTDDMTDKIKLDNEVRYENLIELANVASSMQTQYNLDLDGFLEKMALYSQSNDDDKTNSVKLMTIHASKGLEFKDVFIIGAEEGIIPNAKSSFGDKLEEQRRMMYVAVTRAKENLYISHCRFRKDSCSSGEIKHSRFLPEINPDRYIYI